MHRLGGLLLSAGVHAVGLALLVGVPLFLDAAVPPAAMPQPVPTLPGIQVRLPAHGDSRPTSAQPSSSSKQRGSWTVRAGKRLWAPTGVSDITDIAPDDLWSTSIDDDPCLGCGDGLALVGSPGTGGRPGLEPPEPSPVRSGVHVREPRRQRHVAPGYPELARQAHVQGSVVIECVIDASGRVVEAHVVSGHPLLAPAALDAVGQWVYTPTLLNGVPVSVLLTVTVVFSLR